MNFSQVPGCEASSTTEQTSLCDAEHIHEYLHLNCLICTTPMAPVLYSLAIAA